MIELKKVLEYKRESFQIQNLTLFYTSKTIKTVDCGICASPPPSKKKQRIKEKLTNSLFYVNLCLLWPAFPFDFTAPPLESPSEVTSMDLVKELERSA